MSKSAATEHHDERAARRDEVLEESASERNPESVAADYAVLGASLREALGQLLRGQERLIEEVLIALIARGHLLLEGPPGVGKTLLARAVGQLLGLRGARLQCTPDLLPADILGGQTLIEGPQGPLLRFQEGPIFCELFFVDELNRASPRTQSALLEAMAERQITLSGRRLPLGPPFQVIATQNPLEQEGTFPLPEAQSDRFLFQCLATPPSEEILAELVDARPVDELDQLSSLLSAEELLRWQRHCTQLPITGRLRRWIARLVYQAQPEEAPRELAASLRGAVSPRAVQALADAARAAASLQGRLHVEGADLLRVAPAVLRHRLQLHWRAEEEGFDRERLCTALIAAQPKP